MSLLFTKAKASIFDQRKKTNYKTPYSLFEEAKYFIS